MDILFISYKYPPSIGGMQKQSYQLINGFKDCDNVYSIIYNQKDSLIFFFISLLWRIPLLLRSKPNIDVIHFNDGVCALCCSWTRIYRQKLLIATYHGLDLVFPNVIYQKFLLALVRSFDAIITVSEHTKRECIKRGFDPSKVFMVSNGVDHAAVDIDMELVSEDVLKDVSALKARGIKIALSIGRPVRRKGYVWFVKNVLNKLPDDMIYVLIGSEPDKNTFFDFVLKILPEAIRQQVVLFLGLTTEHHLLNNLSEKMDIKDRFIWYKNIDHITKEYILSKSDLLVMPNVEVDGDMEGFGLVALEANMHNVPVVASNIEGITSAVIDKKNGLLVPASSIDDWSNAIYNDIHMQEWDCRDFAISHYSWEKMVYEYRHVFAMLIHKSKKEKLKLSNVYT